MAYPAGSKTDVGIRMLLPTRPQGWKAEEFAQALGVTQKNVLLWLRAAQAEGVAVKVGPSGPVVRWYAPEFAEAGREQYRSEAAARKRAKSKRLAERRKRERALKIKPKPKNVKKDRVVRPAPVEAFTIPPRGVPCSVWALGAMA